MFGFRKKKADSAEIMVSSEDKPGKQENSVGIAEGYTSANVVQNQVHKAAKTFAKPDTYTGNRDKYDSGAAKANAKKNLFQSGEKVYDPYTGDELKLTRQEARMSYGDNYNNHLAESDHVRPLDKIYDETKNNVWNTTEDIKNAANSEDNIRVVSRKYNNAKRNRTNKDFVEDEDYLQRTGVELTEQGKNRAIEDDRQAKLAIERKLNKSGFHNAIKTGHEAGVIGAKNAGGTAVTISTITNVVDVIKGEKDVEDAVLDIVKDGGKGAVTGYAMGNGLTVLQHTLSGSSSKFIQGLAKSNVPGKVITAVMVTGDTLKKWGEGEISTQECLIELGDKGLNMATIGYSMSVGQALIPIPIVGGAVGALVGSMLTSGLYNNLINDLKTKQLEHEERIRIIAECNAAVEQTRKFREELEGYLQSYLKDYRECFDAALSSMKLAWQMGDADGMIAGANDITRKLGGKIQYETTEEFKDFFDSDESFVL